MKKLLKFSTLALVMLSLFTVSCDKAEVTPAAVDEVTVTWTPEFSSGPITTKGDVKDGEYLKEYVIQATLAAPPCPDGTWSIRAEPAGKEYYAGSVNKKGKFIFRPFGLGTYKVIMTYKCPGCKEVTVIVNITIK